MIPVSITPTHLKLPWSALARRAKLEDLLIKQLPVCFSQVCQGQRRICKGAGIEYTASEQVQEECVLLPST